MAAPEVARFRRRAHIALFDATTLRGKAVKGHLAARSFPTASVRLFTSSSDPEANLSDYAGEAMLVAAPDIEALGKLDIAFLCGTREEGARYLDWAGRAGFVAIDLTGAASSAPGVTVVNASVNPEAVSGSAGVIATPHPVSQLLSTLLAPIRRHGGLREAEAVVLQPASQFDSAGIDELHQQSIGLMNFQEMPRQIFGRQLAFNVLPAWLQQEGQVPGADRAELEGEILAITGGGYSLAVQVVQAPVFHGHAAMVHLVLENGRVREDLLGCFKGSDEVRLARRGDAMTPVERAGETGVLLAGFRRGRDDSSFWVWAVSDDLAGGTTLNAVRIAEALLEPARARVRA
ncbi:MAG TPA: Asd/ArgC dimerization domain-containing protein [Candidatus Dormibacteraeota bacterium]|nr:Asd/ArgC dimerization domain-containing protein [Candidatus Dormibacteraeota bacterium]